MRIAYLVLAHDNPRHLKRLVDRLSADDTTICIHLDAKADLRAFADVRRDGVTFCEERIDCAWGTISLVDATLALVRTALAGPPAARYALVSGACYPVQTRKYIDAFLAQSPTTEYIEAFPFPDPAYGKPLERLTRYYIRRNRPFARAKWRVQDALHALLPSRDYRDAMGGLALAAGSQWWVLSAAALAHVVAFVDAHPRFYRFCGHMDCPDEFVFQVALWNSPFRDRLAHSLTFTHWEPGRMGPSVIDASFLDRFRATPVVDSEQNNSPFGAVEVLYARKFVDGSVAVVETIDAILAQPGRRKERGPHDVEVGPTTGAPGDTVSIPPFPASG